MRPGEISALIVEERQRKPTGVLMTIRRSKTDPEAQGQLVGVARWDNRLTDPIRALDAWLKVRPAEPDALFTRVMWRNHPTSERIGPRAISRTVQERANAAGFDGVPVSGHSLRAGHATTAAVNGSRSTGSLRRPATATSAPSSTTTFDPPRRWRPPPAATSGSDGIRRSPDMFDQLLAVVPLDCAYGVKCGGRCVVAGSAEHFKALVRSHAAGDDAAFYSVAMQVAAQEARKGHHRIAADLKSAVESSRTSGPKVTSIAQPRGDLADLVIATHPEVALKELVLPAGLASQVRRILTEQRQRKNLLDHGFEPVHRLLFEGPPGTGKTMTAAVLAHELSMPLLTIRLDSLMSKFMGETASKLRVIFDAAEQQRAVYLFDEFDALGGDRTGNDVGEARRILNSFLVFLENNRSESLIVAATNHRQILDRALFRRFDMVLDYALPDPKQGAAVMRGRLGTLAKGVRWASLASVMEGLSHADLVRAAESAAKSVILNGSTQITAEDLRDSLEARKAGSLG
jgi:hypothetical protein